MKWFPWPRASATHRQTRWGLHQRRWSNDAFTTPQRRLRHDWIWTDFLNEQRRATSLVDTAVGRAAKDSLPRCSRKTQDKFAIVSWQRSFCTIAYALMHERVCIFCKECEMCFDSVVEHHACAGVYVRQVPWTSAYTFAYTLQDAQLRSCMCILVVWRWGNEDGGVQLVYESACCLAWGMNLDKRKNRSVVCVFSIFNAGGSLCGCMGVCTHTHAHTAQMGYSDVSPGVGMLHLEGPKNPDGLNVGMHMFAYVYKVHMCMCMLGGGMRSWTNCFFVFHIFLLKKKSFSLYEAFA